MMRESDTLSSGSFHFKWSNVTLQFKAKWHKLPQREFLLRDVSGFASSGEIHAIMGSSGCGKTSLLMALAGKVPSSRKFLLSGDVSLHGSAAKEPSTRVALVPQNDYLFAHLTVRETLQLAAIFYMPDATAAQLEAKVDDVLRELQLVNVQFSSVGSPSKRGVSGGERKRVAIGRELIQTPKILLCDEVTSGLDSFQALAVVQSLKALALAGRIVILTIHQPRSSIFTELDRLSVLTEGMLAYCGRRHGLEPYLDSLGFRTPQGFNVADHLLDLVSLDQRDEGKRASSRMRIDAMCSHFAQVSRERPVLLETELEQELELEQEQEQEQDEEEGKAGSETSERALSVASSSSSSTSSSTSSSYPQQQEEASKPTVLSAAVKYTYLTYVLFWRASVESIRDYNTQLVKLGVLIFLAAILSLLYSKSDQTYQQTQASIQDRIGLLFFVVVNQSFGPVLDVAKVFPEEKVICGKEIASGAYPTSAYFISRFLAALPLALFSSVIYATIIYFSVGLALDPLKYFVFLGVVGMTQVCAQSFGLLLSALAPNTAVATALGSPFVIIFILSGGFYLNTKSFPPGSQWLPFVSYVYYSFAALVNNEFAGLTFSCAEQGSGPCVLTGEQVIRGLGLEQMNIYLALACLGVLTVGFLSLAFVSLVCFKDQYLPMQSARGQPKREPSSVATGDAL